MKEAVLLKGCPNGITVRIEEQVPFEQVLEELEQKFSGARAFWGKNVMALSLEGRKLDRQEEMAILYTIQENSDLKIPCILEREEKTQKLFIKALKETKKRLTEVSGGQFYRGNLTNHETLEIQSSIIILGDVEKGCSVVAGKNIIVLGGLYGRAYAGGSGETDCYIAALEMAPESLMIGDFKYQNHLPGRKLLKAKARPKIASVKGGKLVLDFLTKDLPDSF